MMFSDYSDADLISEYRRKPRMNAAMADELRDRAESDIEFHGSYSLHETLVRLGISKEVRA